MRHECELLILPFECKITEYLLHIAHLLSFLREWCLVMGFIRSFLVLLY